MCKCARGSGGRGQPKWSLFPFATPRVSQKKTAAKEPKMQVFNIFCRNFKDLFPPHPCQDGLLLELSLWPWWVCRHICWYKAPAAMSSGKQHGISLAPPQSQALSPPHVLIPGTQDRLRTGQPAVGWDMLAHDGAQLDTEAVLSMGDTRELFHDFAAQEMTTQHHSMLPPFHPKPTGLSCVRKEIFPHLQPSRSQLLGMSCTTSGSLQLHLH